MSFLDSMFLLEIKVEELKSFIQCQEFYIQSQFSNIFMLNLKDPNVIDPLKTNIKRKYRKRITVTKLKPKMPLMEDKVQVGQSVLFTSRIDSLITAMKNFPIQLTLFDKDEPDYKLGSTEIPWSPVYINYLIKLNAQNKANPVHGSGTYNIYDEPTFKRIVTIKLNIKLTHFKDKLISSPPFRSLSQETHYTYPYSKWGFKPAAALNTVKENSSHLTIRNCPTKSNSPRKLKCNVFNRHKTNKNKNKRQIGNKQKNKLYGPPTYYIQEVNVENSESKYIRTNNVTSDTDLDVNRQIEIVKTKSCSSIHTKHSNLLNGIFRNFDAPLQNQVFCVGYCTVADFKKKSKSGSSSKDISIKNQSSETSGSKSNSKHKIKKQSSGESDSKSHSNSKHKFFLCNKDCPSKHESACDNSVCSFDLTQSAADLITVVKCEQLKCESKIHRDVLATPDTGIHIDLANVKNDCCGVTETIEKVVGEMEAQMKFAKDDCFCSCDCTFGFVKRTTYCEICGGFERPGQDLPRTASTAPLPCPVYNKTIEKKGSGSDKSARRISKSPTGRMVGDGDGTNAESEKDKGKKTKKDERFKFKYGFMGIPAKIGHSRCVMPCTGSFGLVPKHMGWLWNADQPGIKNRPMYKAGAINKHVLHLLKIAKNPDTVLKKRRREYGKPKRPLKRPLLTVAKKDGEYTVTMETMKTFSKPRALNQHPYEDKPLVTYTIGRTEEENRDRQKKREREKRRLERDQRTFIQSAFTDMCKEICLKTYQQALGILPDAEDPECACYPKHPGPDDIDLEHSCSCSELSTPIVSDTDSDEWIVEFTPPNALFDPKYTAKKLTKADSSSQYTYLDYRVKLLDRYGNHVPRFFKGPDGSTQCSDLGGFWSPDHKWLVINTDGYIGPDERWAPMTFIGPSGQQVDCDTGKFQAADGNWLVVGVDGYIDANGKWKFYVKPKTKTTPPTKHYGGKKDAGDKKDDKAPYQSSEVAWSCFGDANPKDISKLGILGHGQDKRLLMKTLKELMAHGETVSIPQPVMVPRSPSPKKGKHLSDSLKHRCRHAIPSDKGVVAVDGRGNKKYFSYLGYKNKRPEERLTHLTQQGISLSSFHTSCFHSFMNQDIMKRQQYEKFMKIKPCEHDDSTKCVSTQYRYKYAI